MRLIPIVFRPVVIAAFIAAYTLFSAASRAAPSLTYLYPAGGTPGTTVSVAIAGKFDHWPLQVALRTEDQDRGVAIAASKEKNKLDITIKPDAQPGVIWFRVIDDTGASALRPFVIDALASLPETEPNDAPEKPNQLTGDVTVDGKLNKSGDVDTYAVALKQGQTLVASMLAERVIASPMDGVLQVCDAAGFVLAQNDDAYGLDPLIVYHVPRDGTYLVRTFAFPAAPDSSIRFAGGDSYVYRLTITTGPFVDHVLPMAVTRGATTDVAVYGWNLTDAMKQARVDAKGDDATTQWSMNGAAGAITMARVDAAVSNVIVPAASTADTPKGTSQAIKLALPCVLSGRIASPDENHAFIFDAVKGQKLNITVASRALGYELDAALRITDAEGKVLAQADDTNKLADPTLLFTPPADGTYRLTLRDVFGHGGFRFVYRMSIEEAKPDFSLNLKDGEVVVTPGKPTEVEVTINRVNGYDAAIEVTAIDLPAGVTVESAKSEAKGATAKAVKLKLTAASGPAQGAITIIGRASARDTVMERRATFPLGTSDATYDQLWLTVLKSK